MVIQGRYHKGDGQFGDMTSSCKNSRALFSQLLKSKAELFLIQEMSLNARAHLSYSQAYYYFSV